MMKTEMIVLSDERRALYGLIRAVKHHIKKTKMADFYDDRTRGDEVARFERFADVANSRIKDLRYAQKQKKRLRTHTTNP